MVDALSERLPLCAHHPGSRPSHHACEGGLPVDAVELDEDRDATSEWGRLCGLDRRTTEAQVTTNPKLSPSFADRKLDRVPQTRPRIRALLDRRMAGSIGFRWCRARAPGVA